MPVRPPLLQWKITDRPGSRSWREGATAVHASLRELRPSCAWRLADIHQGGVVTKKFGGLGGIDLLRLCHFCVPLNCRFRGGTVR